MPSTGPDTLPQAGQHTGTAPRPFYPWQAAVMGAAVVFVLGMMLYFLGHVSKVSGVRIKSGEPMHGRVEHSFLGVIPLGVTELPGIQEARLGVTAKSKGGGFNYRAWVICEAENVPVRPFSGGSREENEDVVRRINGAVKDTLLPSFSFKIGPSAYFEAAAIAFPIVTILVLWGLVRAVRSSPHRLAKKGS
jgi:hypothetical protein